MSILTVEHISKSFGAFQAVKDVSFEINQGEIVGFLGKNGAGKTTLMRIITSFLAPSSGRIFIDGDDITKNSLTIREKVGYLPETPPLYMNMTVFQYLKFAAEIKGISSKKQTIKIAKVLEECNLEEVKQKTISTLSKGYKQRVGIAQAIIHEPKLLILDEPMSGLDPLQIQQVLALISNQREQRTVLLSTHTLTEMEKIAQRILMIKSGQLVIDESLHTLLNGHSDRLSESDNSPSSPVTLEEIFINHHQQQTGPKNTSNDR
ncbi:ABC transporter ATP-binding protein [Psychromonas hadalis]|uniref:ABC transporter ATP-binding protein n=1 Tax=Psychromonas hadalis TaxID=211669 RepID=UPI0003B38DA5|nr:ABC transporter ATP-binding protein [Psychromonas hadalis]